MNASHRSRKRQAYGPQFGAMLRDAREGAGITQRHMADLLLLHRRTVQRAERGDVHLRPHLVDAWLTACGRRVRLVLLAADEPTSEASA